MAQAYPVRLPSPKNKVMICAPRYIMALFFGEEEP